VVLSLVALGISAQDQPVSQEGPSAPPEDALTHGEFAVVLLNAVAGFGYHISDPERALEETKRLGLVPDEWLAEDLLTYGEFADVLGTLGVEYVAADRDEYTSRPWVEAMLRRKDWLIRDYLYVLYHSPGPIVSESGFQQ